MNNQPDHAQGNGIGSATVSAEGVREQLRRILASPAFCNARRSSQFLGFVVEATLAGEDRIKEYLIGAEVFKLPPEYDPKDDPIVRIEAGRLRKKLAEYYSGPGANDRILIDLPKGRYVPVFSERPNEHESKTSENQSFPQAIADPVIGHTSPARASRFLRFTIPVVVLIAILTGCALFVYHSSRRVKPLTGKDTIVLGDFSNSTGDPLFDDTLRTGLTMALSQSPFLNIVPEGQIARTLKLMTRPPGTKLTPDIARELCRRVSSKAYMTGAIATLGSEYVLQLKAVDCQSGDTLAEEQVTASSKEGVLDALGHAASKLRVELGESLGTVQRFDAPLAEVTTPSLEALKAFSIGRKTLIEKGEAAALPYHLRAIELDPRFAAAYRAAGADYGGMGETGRANEYYTKAFQLRDRTSELEKLMISTIYYENVTGELDKSAETYREEIESYPNFPAYIGLGVIYNEQGQHEKATEAYREQLRRTPNSVIGYGNLAFSLLALQRLDEARHTIQLAQERGLDDFLLREIRYALAFIRGDSSAMAEQQRWFVGKPEENNGLALESDTEAYFGRIGNARQLTKQAVDSAIRADSKETGAIWLENAALREAAFGNMTAAQEAAAEGLKMAPASPGASAEAALAFAMAGDAEHAKSLVKDLNNRFPVHTQMQFLLLPPVRAQLTLRQGNPSQAVNDLQPVSPPIEFALIPFLVNVSCLYPTYIRGEAFLAAGDGAAAVSEFQKVLDHSGIVWNCWTGALAHLGIARANALESNSLQGAEADAARARAIQAYKDFFNLWKGADTDIPVFKAAKSEYAKLQ